MFMDRHRQYLTRLSCGYHLKIVRYPRRVNGAEAWFRAADMKFTKDERWTKAGREDVDREEERQKWKEKEGPAAGELEGEKSEWVDEVEKKYPDGIRIHHGNLQAHEQAPGSE